MIKGGLFRNLTRRALLAQDEPWWSKTRTDWKLAVEHPYAANDNILPDYWMDRALDLCENELTHQFFGLTFTDLMQLDPASFEKIEKRVHDFSKRQAERISSQTKDLDVKGKGK